MNLSLANSFGPMSRTNCDYFLILSMIGALLMLLSLVFGIMKYNKNKSILIIILSVLQPFVLYFQNRLLYNMCIRSI
jgi:hypothetical protein